jgi:DivIVA domain-containing protein
LTNIKFPEARRGYDRDYVDNFLREVAVKIGELQEMLRDAEARAAQAEAKLDGIERPGPIDGPDGERVRRLAEELAAAAVREARTIAATPIDPISPL